MISLRLSFSPGELLGSVPRNWHFREIRDVLVQIRPAKT
jgi:hypothetical protein